MFRTRTQALLQFVIAAALACCLTGCLALSGSKSNSGGNNNSNGGAPAPGSPAPGAPAPGGPTAGAPPVPPTPGPNNGPTGDLSAINHIVFMSQENRSFDSYFGHLNDYRAAQGLPTNVDGLPANASNPAFDGSI